MTLAEVIQTHVQRVARMERSGIRGLWPDTPNRKHVLCSPDFAALHPGYLVTEKRRQGCLRYIF